ncbi:MAG: bacteriohemerythrin [Mariprofundaceae bacterium]
METLHTYPGRESQASESLDVDRECLKLIDITNELHQGLRKGHNDLVLNRKYNVLVDYSRRHFAEEERIMLECNYPRYWQHKQEHDHLMQRVVDIQDRLYKGKAELSIELIYLLRHWFTHHVFGEDRSYDHFLHHEAA